MRLAPIHDIQGRFPKDFATLRQVVRRIAPLSPDDAEEGTLGEWKAEQPVAEDRSTRGYGIDATPGVLLMSEESKGDLTGVIAHELGHACTTHEDRSRRGDVVFEEWTEELAADWYAYKWGFGRVIARDRKHRCWLHHGVKPGSTFSTEIAGRPMRFRITRNFVLRQV